MAQADIAQHLHWMVTKCRIMAVSGNALNAFSVCMRAASTASRLRLIIPMLEATAALANLLNQLRDYSAAIDLLDSVLPKACN
jgi:anaphase-promoting complex subunit 5